MRTGKASCVVNYRPLLQPAKPWTPSLRFLVVETRQSVRLRNGKHKTAYITNEKPKAARRERRRGHRDGVGVSERSGVSEGFGRCVETEASG